MKAYEELFVKDFDLAQEIDDTFVSYFNAHDRVGLKSFLNDINANWFDLADMLILHAIDVFTMNNWDMITIMDLMDRMKKIEDVYDVQLEYNEKYHANELIIYKTNVEIRVMPFSKVFPIALENLPDLESEKRESTCFQKALDISLSLGIPNEVVTGYVFGHTDKSKFLHSWVKTEYKGEKFVIDDAFNAMYNVKGFYNVRHAKEITTIKDNVVYDDLKTYLSKITNFPLEAYFVFRDEIIEEIKRNEEVFIDKKESR